MKLTILVAVLTSLAPVELISISPLSMIRLYPEAMTKSQCSHNIFCNKEAGGVCTKRQSNPKGLEGDRYYCNCLNAVNFPQNNSGPYCNRAGCLFTTCAYNETCENEKSPKIGGPFGKCVAAVCNVTCNETADEVCVYGKNGNYCCADCDPNRCYVEGGCNEAAGGMCKKPGFFFNDDDACYCGEVNNYPLSNVGPHCNESYVVAHKRNMKQRQEELEEMRKQWNEETLNKTKHPHEDVNALSFWEPRSLFRGLFRHPFMFWHSPWYAEEYTAEKEGSDIGMVSLRTKIYGLLEEYEKAGKAANRTIATFDKQLDFKRRFRHLYVAQDVSTHLTGGEWCWRYGFICHKHAHCVSSERSCKCKSGYLGNGYDCTRMCTTDNGKTYKMHGPTVTSFPERPCLAWTEAVKKLEPDYTAADLPKYASLFADGTSNLANIKNYCRLPMDGTNAFGESHPWCFYENDKGEILRNLCDVPNC